ncbi:hypothetical protein WJX74_009917 [Apatococcus lobatus]|uniref:Uncharacterized protein n=1 Tax=Apatococcus lobatus TaxID=904363 RepID=A0AAW1R3N0_9CHLO
MLRTSIFLSPPTQSQPPAGLRKIPQGSPGVCTSVPARPRRSWQGFGITGLIIHAQLRAYKLRDDVRSALKGEQTVNSRPKYAVYRKQRASYYEFRQNFMGQLRRVRCFRVPDILIEQNKHEFRDAERGIFHSTAQKVMLLERDAVTDLTVGQIREAADCAKDLKTKACALVLAPGTPVTQIAEIEASMLGVDLIRNHGCQQRLQDDIHNFVKRDLEWTARRKEPHELPDG